MALLRALRLPRRVVWVAMALAAIGACIPVGGLPLAAYVRGVLGDLSMPLLIVMGSALWHYARDRRQQNLKERNILLVIAALCGLIFYPLALGVGYTDPYRLGFGNIWFVALLLAFALCAIYKNFYLLASCVMLSVLAWSIHLYEANNLWNYLLDPLLVIYAVMALAGQGIVAVWQSRKCAALD